MRAPYVAIEGLDGSGGTTQVQRLATRLRERLPVVVTREPSEGPVGRLIRTELAGGSVGDDVLPYLFAADRRDHLDRVVLPALGRREAVVSDRCALSSFAYQSAALGLMRVMELNADFRPPDRIFFLQFAPEACLERIERRGLARERFETLAHLRRTELAYRVAIDVCRQMGWDVVEVDAARQIDEVAATIWARAAEVLAWPG